MSSDNIGLGGHLLRQMEAIIHLSITSSVIRGLCAEIGGTPPSKSPWQPAKERLFQGYLQTTGGQETEVCVCALVDQWGFKSVIWTCFHFAQGEKHIDLTEATQADTHTYTHKQNVFRVTVHGWEMHTYQPK